METDKSLAVAEVRPSALGLQQMEVGAIDMLEDAVEIPVDLMTDYWSPVNKGESKRVLFDCIDVTEVPDPNGVAIELECAFFYVKENNEVHRIRNGSKRLVGALHNMPRGTALVITYNGKVKNKNNAFLSDSWSIKPLKYEVKPQ